MFCYIDIDHSVRHETHLSNLARLRNLTLKRGLDTGGRKLTIFGPVTAGWVQAGGSDISWQMITPRIKTRMRTEVRKRTRTKERLPGLRTEP